MMREKEEAYSPETMRMIEKSLLLQILDQTWKDHLLQLDHLRQGIYLRGYAQRDPLNEYKREAFQLFSDMLTALRETVTRMLCHVQLRLPEAPEPPPQPIMEESHPSVAAAGVARSRLRADARRRRRHGLDRRGRRPHLAQRALPLRLGQEIQALPRQGVSGGHDHRDGTAAPAAVPRARPDRSHRVRQRLGGRALARPSAAPLSRIRRAGLDRPHPRRPCDRPPDRLRRGAEGRRQADRRRRA